MNIAVIGAYGHYNLILDAIQDDPALKIIASVGPVDFIGEHKYDSFEDLLKNEKPDAVAVNDIYNRNADYSIKCLEKGIIVFSEKPLATDQKKLEQLYDAWIKSGTPIGLMMNLRYSSWFRTAEKAVNDSRIGDVRMINARKSYKLGQRPDFYRRRSEYGGIIPWVGIHAIDWAVHFGGSVRRFSAVQNRTGNKGMDELEMTSAVLAEHKNGVISTVTADFLRPEGAARHDDDRLRITGTDGCIEAFDGKVFLEDKHGKSELDLEPGINCFNYFLNSIGSDHEKADTERAFEITRLSLAARDAGDKGETIWVI